MMMTMMLCPSKTSTKDEKDFNHSILHGFASVHKYLTTFFPESVQILTSVTNSLLVLDKCSTDRWSNDNFFLFCLVC